MRIFVSVLLLFLSFFILAQPALIDSLEQKLANSNDQQKVDIYNQLTKAYIYQSLDNSIKYNQEAKSLAQNINYKLGYAKAIFYDAKIKNYQGNYPDARKLYLEAQKLYQDLGDVQMTANVTSIYGMSFYSEGNYQEAYKHVLSAYEIIKDSEYHNEIAKITNHLGLCQWRMGNLDQALDYYLASLEIAPNNSNTINNISIIYGIMENNQQALEYQMKALSIRQKNNDQEGILDSYNNLGLIYKQMHKPYTALEYMHKSVDLARKIKKFQDVSKALNNIGAVYDSELDIPDSALVYYRKSIAGSSNFQNQYDFLNTKLNIGNLEARLGNYEIGSTEINEVLKLAGDIGAKELVMNSHKALSDIDYSAGNFRNAYNHLKEYSTIKDSVFNEKSQANLADLQVKFDLEKKENEKKQIQLELKNKSTNNLLLSLIIFVLFIVIATIYLYLRSQAKMNQILQNEIQQRKEIETHLERTVDARTQEIKYKNQQLKSEIEEHKKLERKLQEYKDSLQRQVDDRTNELKLANQKLIASNNELEKANTDLKELNKLFVGREFRIKELRDKVKELEAHADID